MRHCLPAILGLTLLLASCAPALSGGSSVSNPTAFGPRGSSGYGEIQRVTHSALFSVKLTGEPYVITNSPGADLSINELLQDRPYRCTEIEHLFWMKGDVNALSADFVSELKKTGGSVIQGERRTDGYRGFASLKGQMYMFEWWKDAESAGYSACRLVSR